MPLFCQPNVALETIHKKLASKPVTHNFYISAWSCPSCKAAYDPKLIEYRLVLDLERRVMSFSVQDLTCVKCNRVKQPNMTTQCECAGEPEQRQSEIA